MPGVQSSGAATSLALLGAVATTITNFGIAVLVAQRGAAFAGLFFTATAVITIAGNSSALGSMTGLVFFMPEATDGPHPNPRGLLRTALTPVVGVATVGAVAMVAVASPLAAAVAGEGADQIATMLRLLAPVIPCWAMTQALLGATRGLGTMTPTAVVNQMLRPLGQLVLVGAVVMSSADPSPAAMALAWGVPVVVSVGAALWWVWRLGGLTGHGPSPVSATRFWSFTRPRGISTAFQIALERIDVVIVSALAGEATAGIYGAISRFVTAGNFLIFAIGQATSAPLRRAVADQRLDQAQALLAKVTGWTVFLVWPYLLAVAVKSETLATLINPDFAIGASALSLLAVAILASAFAGPVDLTLLMLGRSQTSLAITVVALVTDVVVAWLAVPRWGLIGAAVAWGSAVVIQNGLAALAVGRLGGLRVGGRPALVAAAGAALAVIPVGLATPDTLTGTLITGLVAGVVWLGWGVVFRSRLSLSRP